MFREYKEGLAAAEVDLINLLFREYKEGLAAAEVDLINLLFREYKEGLAAAEDGSEGKDEDGEINPGTPG